jgi:hypothetical protein
MVKYGVLSEVQAEFLSTVYMSFGFKIGRTKPRALKIKWSLRRRLLKHSRTTAYHFTVYVIIPNISRFSIKPTAHMLGKPRGLLYTFVCRTAG